MVAETRNYLIAASQNITNTHRYLSNVNIPYFNTEDLRVRVQYQFFFSLITLEDFHHWTSYEELVKNLKETRTMKMNLHPSPTIF